MSLILFIALPAFLSSFNISYDMIADILSRSKIKIDSKNYNDALNMWKSLCPEDDIPINANLQAVWDLPFTKKILNEITKYE